MGMIRLRAGDRETMPQLADREVAFVRDEQALYIGTAAGNLQLCSAAAAGRLTALESTDQTHGDAIAALKTADKTHGDAIAALKTADKTHGDAIAALKTADQTHDDAITALKAADKTHGNAITALKAADKTHEDAVAALDAARVLLEQTAAAQGTRLTEVETVQKTQGDTLTALAAEKLTAVPMACLSPVGADAGAAELAQAYNALLAALQTAGMMASTGENEVKKT